MLKKKSLQTLLLSISQNTSMVKFPTSSKLQSSLVFFFFLLLLSSAGCFASNVELQSSSSASMEMDLLDLEDLRFTFQQIATAPPTKTTCFASSHKPREKAEGGIVLELKQQDSCTRPVKNLDERLHLRLLLDDIQVRTLQTRIRNPLQTLSPITGPRGTRIPLSSGSRLQILNYVTTMQIGNRNLTVIVDTGSDLTWVQCQPCNSCYSQQQPLFNPSSSPTYQPVPCNTTSCRSFQQATGDPGGCDRTNNNNNTSSPCRYYVSYGDGSYTSGELGIDRLSLGLASVTDRFVFGCGQSNKGLFGSASGLMGLGPSVLSLVSQSTPVFGGVFSYCLPSSDDFDSSGSLTFGPQSPFIYKNATPLAYTKMVRSPQLSSFYLLNLTGISVGGVDLHSPRFLSSNLGILIDSGTIITRIPPSIYAALKGQFLEQFSGYPSAPGYSILDTCFNLSGYQEVNLPTVKLKFEGDVEVKVDVGGVMYFVRSNTSQVCLAFASLSYEDEVPIIGNYQQKNMRVVYDTKQFLVGFAQETCSF